MPAARTYEAIGSREGAAYTNLPAQPDNKDEWIETGCDGADHKGRSRKTYCDGRNEASVDRREGLVGVEGEGDKIEDLLAWSPYKTQKYMFSSNPS